MANSRREGYTVPMPRFPRRFTIPAEILAIAAAWFVAFRAIADALKGH